MERDDSIDSIKRNQKWKIGLLLELYRITDCKPVLTSMAFNISSIQKESLKILMQIILKT